MSLPETPTLSARLASLAQRLGLIGRGSKHVLAKASTLRLPFRSLPQRVESICWHAAPPLQRLVDLPRGALSGPVQEDKAQAHAALSAIVEVEYEHLPDFDLRLIDGFSCNDNPQAREYQNFEDYAASAHCRQIRIISYKDFLRTLSLALPGFSAGEPIDLRQASWRGDRIFWSGEQRVDAFAGALTYARLRGLQVSVPANLARYCLSATGIDELDRQYHALAMPGEAWSDSTFMGLLLDNGLPYARLSLLRGADAPEFLLLPKHHQEADALGEGLRLAGAPDMLGLLRNMQN